jgi:NAD(P)-dependent dehydrogenase (short-subunit alcohol dehydrogenase family)
VGAPIVGAEGLRVVITASTQGIGFYAASSLASLGARVVVNGRSMERARGAASRAGAAGWVVADISTREGVERLLEEAYRILGGVDLVVFNAPNVSCEPCYLHEAGYGDWEEAARKHLIAPGYLASLYVRRLLGEKRRGTLVFLSSVTVKAPMPHFALADTARAGLVQLAKSIALRYGAEGVKAFTVLLGSFDTPGARRNIAILAEREGVSFEEAWRRWVIELSALRRLAKPEELGALLAFLASPYSDYMNGTVLTMDGVMTACV